MMELLFNMMGGFQQRYMQQKKHGIYMEMKYGKDFGEAKRRAVLLRLTAAQTEDSKPDWLRLRRSRYMPCDSHNILL